MLTIDPDTHLYLYRKCGNNGFSLSGFGTIKIKGSVITLEHNFSVGNVLARVDVGLRKGTASVRFIPNNLNVTISDRNLDNSSCECP